MRKRNFGEWSLASYLSDIRSFERLHGIDRYLAQILANRGVILPEEMHRWINVEYSNLSDPMLMVDISKAVERIWKALNEGAHITVYGDYDADGICSAAILYLALRKVSHAPHAISAYIPNRFKERRGLHRDAINQLHRRGTKLIITTDCGSSDGDAIAYAASLGIDVIITDHHEVPIQLPEAAYALVNPCRLDANGENKYLCGSGVAFKIAQALYRSGGVSKFDEQGLLGLVALGTIADVVPLVGDNHILVRLGLLNLQQTQNIGLLALLQAASIRRDEPIRERAVAFYLAPRINAAARMDDPHIAFTLLTTDQSHEAYRLVGDLEILNQRRQHETDLLYQLALDQAELQLRLPVIMVDGEDWHEGIIGLVAGKLLEKYARPTVVISKEPHSTLCHGSVRSTVGFNIVEALRRFDGHFEHAGGHARAAGFTIQEKFLNGLHLHLLHEWERLFPLWPQVHSSVNEKIIDIELANAGTLTSHFYQLLHCVGPYGSGFREPIFLLRKLHLTKITLSRFGTYYLDLSSPNGEWKGSGRVTASRWREEWSGFGEEEGWVTVVFSLEGTRGIGGDPILRLEYMEKYGKEEMC